MAEAFPGGPKTVADVLGLTSAYLAAKGSPTARLDGELLLGEVLGLSRLELYLHHDRPLTPGELDALRPLVRRRGEGEPVAYILGRAGFRGIELAVDPRVLLPRPETEGLVEIGLALLPRGGSLVDVGTGSGAIAIAAAQERPDATVTAVDLASDALAVAQANAVTCGVDVEFLLGDLLEPVAGRGVDVILANLPYIAEGDPRVEEHVKRYEPKLALYAGSDGLDAIRRLIPASRGVLVPGGALALEVGVDQSEVVATLLAEAGFGGVERHRDLAGHERIVVGRAPGA
jgi:release factor glutamine methyltransferase